MTARRSSILWRVKRWENGNPMPPMCSNTCRASWSCCPITGSPLARNASTSSVQTDALVGSGSSASNAECSVERALDPKNGLDRLGIGRWAMSGAANHPPANKAPPPMSWRRLRGRRADLARILAGCVVTTKGFCSIWREIWPGAVDWCLGMQLPIWFVTR